MGMRRVSGIFGEASWVTVICHFSVSVFIASVLSPACQAQTKPGYQLTFHDEFTGSSVNAGVWNVLNRQNSQNNEKQYYLPSQATIVNNDILRITADKPAQPVGGKSYLSARLESKATFGPGSYYEARIDLPAGKGMWPAFWLNANSVQWPLGGEIDVMENKGRLSGDVSSAFHYQKNPGPCCSQHFYVVKDYIPSPSVNFQAGFHTYAVDWQKKQLKFYVDDRLTFTVDETTAMSDANFLTKKNIILNLAVGGDFDGDPDASSSFPQYMDVDYVRVWTPIAVPEPTTSSMIFPGAALLLGWAWIRSPSMS
jgi:beta-glucanase (GH16 family)